MRIEMNAWDTSTSPTPDCVSDEPARGARVDDVPGSGEIADHCTRPLEGSSDEPCVAVLSVSEPQW
jgi:hypothetical protein